MGYLLDSYEFILLLIFYFVLYSSFNQLTLLNLHLILNSLIHPYVILLLISIMILPVQHRVILQVLIVFVQLLHYQLFQFMVIEFIQAFQDMAKQIIFQQMAITEQVGYSVLVDIKIFHKYLNYSSFYQQQNIKRLKVNSFLFKDFFLLVK